MKLNSEEIGVSTLPDIVQVDYELSPKSAEIVAKLAAESNKKVKDINSHDYNNPDYDESSLGKVRVPEFSKDDKDYLVKTLSSIKNSIEASKASSDDKSRLSNKVMSIVNHYHKTGVGDDISIRQVIDEIKSLKDSGGNRTIKIEFEDSVNSAVDSNIHHKILEDTHARMVEKLIEASEASGLKGSAHLEKLASDSIGINSYLQRLVSDGINIDGFSKLIDEMKSGSHLVSTYFADIMGDTINSLTSAQIGQINELKSMYSTGDISREYFIDSIKALNDKFDQEGSEEAESLKELSVILKSIESNTDPENNELSNAERILERNKYDLEKENSELLAQVLGDISSRDNDAVSKGILEGVTSAEQAGEALADSALDWLLGDDDGGGLDIDYYGRDDDSKRRSPRRRPTRNRKSPRGPRRMPRVPTAALQFASKAAVPVAVAANVGMAGYEYFTAEDQQGRNEAIGGGVGGTAGAIGGAKVGALAGAAVGSFIPVVGTVVGGAVGGILGAIGGSLAGSSLGKKVAGWFSDITDIIPDEVKDAGPINELDYIDRVLMPALEQDLANSNSTYKESDKRDLIEYRKKLIEKQIPSAVEDQIKSADIDTADVQARMNFVKEYYGALKNANPELYIDILGSLPEDYKPMVESEINLVRRTQAEEWIGGSSSSSPVAYDPTSIGSVSERYESGGRGVSTISSGKGDPGGVSYGKYQLASKTGTMQAFLNSEEGAAFKDEFRGLRPGTKKFNEVYERLARERGEEFNAAQHAFIGRTHYNPVADAATDMGFDTENKAIQEALWSQSVQHGRSGNLRILGNVKNSGVDMDDHEAVIREIYNQRAQYVAGLRSVPESTRKSILDRYGSELQDVLAVNRMDTTPEDVMLASAESPISASSIDPDQSSDPDLQSSDGLTDDEKALIAHYRDQGMDNPGSLSLATGIDSNRVNSYLNGSSTMSNRSGDIDVSSISSDSLSESNQAPIIVNASGGSGSSVTPRDDYRISDDSVSLAALMT